MREKPVVGQTVFRLNTGNRARHSPQELTPVKVTKVGKKYFSTNIDGREQWGETQFSLETWLEKNDCTPDFKIYVSEQEWKDEKESDNLKNTIREKFQYMSFVKLPLEALREIAAIIKKYERV